MLTNICEANSGQQIQNHYPGLGRMTVPYFTRTGRMLIYLSSDHATYEYLSTLNGSPGLIFELWVTMLMFKWAFAHAGTS